MSFLTKRARSGFEPERHMQALRERTIPCTSCGRTFSLDGLTPLTPVRCPKCEDVNFVPQKIADFWLIQPLGAGGMGATYRAWRTSDADTHTSYAVKILPRENKESPKLIRLLQNEGKVLTHIGRHPCMVGAIATGFEDGEYFLATQFIDGQRLDVMIERLGRMSEIDVLCMGLRLLSAETHIYNRGYLFRDLKPQNIIIHDEHGAYLFDFGICEPVEVIAQPDDTDTVEGSAIYIPPERLTCIGERAAAEIYSLGMVMYEALKGQSYFTAQEIDSLVRSHAREFRLNNTSDKMKGLAWDTAVVLAKMIERSEDDRYKTFAEVEFELTAILGKRLAELTA